MDIDICIQFIIALISAAAIGVSCWISTREMKNANSVSFQLSRETFFAEYTKRYHDIILAMPDDVFLGTAKAEGATLKYMQLYFDLCSEEYYLHQTGHIPEDVWNKWKDGMIITTKLRLYKTCWSLLGGNYNEDFARFMTHEILAE